ncbi:Hypothetical predicted protein [Mytilus galloprovincialis]|uniref:C-type lectin domain-containing protein n=1 Tax=Mytilus galloprovincialis TaxID=29158 RepID=A0A8B6FMP6_MYTGA|nr:Hypothetical predicted protein [Mytilus galloprovincialis]
MGGGAGEGIEREGEWSAVRENGEGREGHEEGEKGQEKGEREFTMQNVTFSNGKKSWKDAVNHCSVRGGVLESNINLLKEQDEFKNVIENDEKMWIGKFKTLTNWTYIRDNDADLGYIYENYQDAADHCERQGSFIKWHSICNSTDLPGYWTSGTRHDETFVIRKAYFTENLQPKNCFILKKNGGEEKKNCDDDFRFFCRFETDEDKGDIISIPNLSMSPKTTVQSDNYRGIIIGIVVSIIVVILIIVGTLVFMIRRIRSRNLLSLSTIVKDEPSTRRTDSSTVTAAYEELNETDKDKSTHCQSYDQLQSVNVADTAMKTNTKFSIEEESKYETIEEPSEKYSNALTAEYEQLEQTEIVKTTNVYDPLHYTRVKYDPTNARSNNSVSREEHRKYETSQTENETDTNGVPLEYEQLDITKIDTSTKAYDELPVTHTAQN